MLPQELYMMSIRVISEMIVKGEYGFNAEMVYQDKACAVGEAQPSVIKLPEYSFCRGFNIAGNFKDVDVAFVHPVHELDGGIMAASHLKEGISLVKDIVGCVKNGLFLLKPQINGFCLWIILVVRNGEGAKCAGVYKDLQPSTSPYRYLS